jgi:hypothetical protein
VAKAAAARPRKEVMMERRVRKKKRGEHYFRKLDC